MTQRIDKAINIFLNAIEKGTLAKGTCSACAVGNLVANGINIDDSDIKIGINNGFGSNSSRWGDMFSTDKSGKQHIHIEELNNRDVVDNIEATDFTWGELAKIEYAFETNTKIYYTKYCNYTKEEIRKDQIKGLEAVVQVMLDFDDCKDKVEEVFTSKVEMISV